MKSILVAATMALLCGCHSLHLGESPDSPLTLSVTAGDEAESLHVVLRNTSKSPVHVLLGSGNGGYRDLRAFSFFLVNSHGQSMEFAAFGAPMEGVIASIDEEIAPGASWSRDIPLETLVLTDHLENPMLANRLPAGSYRVRAVFQGEWSDWPKGGRPYWVGAVESAPATYVLAQ
jgi:hypothetical protein